MKNLKDRLHALDGLRGVAAAFVVLHHLVFSNIGFVLADRGYAGAARFMASIGASGVELFFCLSAVVLMRPHLRQGVPFDQARYAKRRLSRLFPPFFLAWLIAGATVALVWSRPTWWTLSSEVPRFDTGTWFSQIALGLFSRWDYNAAWWSLSVELLFYAVIPAGLVLLMRARNLDRTVAWTLGACLCGALAVFPFADRVDARFVIIARLFYYASCFAAGIFLARRDLAPRDATIAIGVGVLIVAGGVASPAVNLHVGYGLIYFGIIALAMDHRTRTSRQLSHVSFIWLGERSYSLFLTHYSAIYLSCYAISLTTQGKTPEYLVESRLLAIVGAAALAAIVFQLAERWAARGLVTANMTFPWSVGQSSLPQPEAEGPGKLEH